MRCMHLILSNCMCYMGTSNSSNYEMSATFVSFLSCFSFFLNGRQCAHPVNLIGVLLFVHQAVFIQHDDMIFIQSVVTFDIILLAICLFEWLNLLPVGRGCHTKTLLTKKQQNNLKRTRLTHHGGPSGLHPLLHIFSNNTQHVRKCNRIICYI